MSKSPTEFPVIICAEIHGRIAEALYARSPKRTRYETSGRTYRKFSEKILRKMSDEISRRISKTNSTEIVQIVVGRFLKQYRTAIAGVIEIISKGIPGRISKYFFVKKSKKKELQKEFLQDIL